MIEYLKGFTGPYDCHVMTGYGYVGYPVVRKFGYRDRVVCINTSPKESKKICEKSLQKKYLGLGPIPIIKKRKVVFIEGKPHLLHRSCLLQIKGISTQRQKFTFGGNGKTLRCKGKTLKGFRCKRKTKHKSRCCYKHR